jgi:hypothetical protein
VLSPLHDGPYSAAVRAGQFRSSFGVASHFWYEIGMRINIQVMVTLVVVGDFRTPAISLQGLRVAKTGLVQQEPERTPSKIGCNNCAAKAPQLVTTPFFASF